MEQNAGEGKKNRGEGVREIGCLNRQRGGGAAQGDSRFGWGTFRGTGQNSGR